MAAPVILLINPGSGPVFASTLQRTAEQNVRALRRETGLKGVKVEYVPGSRRNGRYEFILSLGGKRVSVDMPGVTRERIEADWLRCYVDGNSWYWEFAVSQVRDALS